MKNKILFIFLSILAINCIADTTYVSGTVSGVWDTSGSPYVITDSTWFIDTLLIESGVEVILHSSLFLCDSSYIRAIGTEDSIYFYGNENIIYLNTMYYSYSWDIIFEKCVFNEFESISVPAKFNECRFIDSDFGGVAFLRGYSPTTKCRFENCNITGYADILVNCQITGDSITLFAPEGMGAGGLFLYSCTIFGNGLISGDFSGSPRDINYVYAKNCLIVGNPSFSYEWFNGYNCETINTTDICLLNRLFSDYSHGDFHLADSSLAIGAGDTTFLRYFFYLESETLLIDHDLDGNPRPNPAGSMPDLGCYENSRAIAEAIGETPSARPEAISLFAYPNPFNSAVTISLRQAGTPDLPADDLPPVGQASVPVIEIFDINGRMVETLRPSATSLVKGGTEPAPLNKAGRSGARDVAQRQGVSFTWQSEKSLSSGVFLVRATIGDRNIVKRIIYLK
ncbi:MAG: hypothetical protein KAG97_00945 [Victivallales bacterium]|nr:hypothetical protein [Victivallales bacterium]